MPSRKDSDDEERSRCVALGALTPHLWAKPGASWSASCAQRSTGTPQRRGVGSPSARAGGLLLFIPLTFASLCALCRGGAEEHDAGKRKRAARSDSDEEDDRRKPLADGPREEAVQAEGGTKRCAPGALERSISATGGARMGNTHICLLGRCGDLAQGEGGGARGREAGAARCVAA